jgi:hypothetical protein
MKYSVQNRQSAFQKNWNNTRTTKYIHEEDVFHRFDAGLRSKITYEMLPEIDGKHLPRE